jgi:hypothetical protein
VAIARLNSSNVTGSFMQRWEIDFEAKALSAGHIIIILLVFNTWPEFKYTLAKKKQRHSHIAVVSLFSDRYISKK